ncbi:MAG: RHS repeat-associated core domain-containing protein [Anaerolineae bacterium]
MARREQGPTNAGDTDITQYTWDHRNRLTKVEHRASYAAAVDHVVEYAYDYVNRWVYKRLDDDGDGHAEQRRIFVYDGNQIVMDFWRTNSGNMQIGHLRERYLWGPAVDQILAEEAVDGGTADLVQWTLTDHLNTVRDIAKYNSGSDMTTVVNHLIYDAFGKVTSESNPAVDSLFLFTARPFDADTELQNNLNRWYDARVGRWLSEDPIGFAGGDGNLYRYVNNSSTKLSDPAGTVAIVCQCQRTSLGAPGSFVTWFYDVVVNCTGLAATCCQAACTGSGPFAFFQWTGRWYVLGSGESERPTAAGICCRVKQSPQCAGCNCKDIAALFSAAAQHHVPFFQFENGHIDHCHRWAESFIDSQPPSPCYTLEKAEWHYALYDLPPFSWDIFGKGKLGHGAVRVRICDGTVFYFDDGWWGGVFWPSRVPPWAIVDR